MATLAELLRDRALVPDGVVEHLQRLVGSWGILSDLSFSDLLLFVPTATDNGRFVVVGQMRPTTSQTLHLEDLLGREVGDTDRPVLSRAWALGTVVEEEMSVAARSEQARVVCIPVRFRGEIVAMLTRESPLVVGRRAGELERVYVGVFDRIARMVAAGTFPYPLDEPLSSEAPRVGDGVMTLDASARIEFASPNAVNALHRLGMYRGILGASLAELGIEHSPVPAAFSEQVPASEELEVGEVAVFIRCIPLLDQHKVTGALVLVRDVTDIRRRDRLLLGKDVAIREVHHRVKNNLQTISSLLRLQARRLPKGDARHALEEAERRVRSIAVVHEILSRDTADEVDFNDILPSLVRMAEDLSNTSPPVRVTWSGEAGLMGAQVATPLAVALNELLQNAVEHAFVVHTDIPGAGVTRDVASLQNQAMSAVPEPARVKVSLNRRGDELFVQIRDNGSGLPDDFSVDATSSLGLSIVRGLVNSQLGGKLQMYNDRGAVAEVLIPVSQSDRSDLARI
jgi:two-component system, sensor histidine kinase PdtaS